MTDVSTILPRTFLERFCDTIAYSKDDRPPNAVERGALMDVLSLIVQFAHRHAVTPERVLIELKRGWVKVCHREASPDMHDPHWTHVVSLTLDVYERFRENAA
jgi:hypothetical protein